MIAPTGKRAVPLLLLTLTVVFSTGWSWKDLFSDKADRAMELYNEGKYEEALELYSEEVIENPDSPELSYNLGNMLYRNKRFDDALPSYSQAQKQQELQQLARFNTGNSLVKSGMNSGDSEKLKKALESYREAIRMAPDDLDAKYNYEFVKKILSDQQDQEQQQDQQENDKQEDQQEKDEQQQDQQQRDQQEKDEQQQDQQQEDQQENDEQQQDQQQEDQQQTDSSEERSNSQPEQNKMSEEDAERMLDAITKKEKEQLAERFKSMGEGVINVEKDW